MQPPVPSATVEAAQREDVAQRLAGAYRECFGSDPGKKVLADIMNQFPPERPRFSSATGFDPIKAAVCDGQSQVTAHVKFWLEREPAEPKKTTTNLTD